MKGKLELINMKRNKFIGERIKKERRCGKGVYDVKNRTLYIENLPFIYPIFKNLLIQSGIYDKWHKNALTVRIKHETWYLDNLPDDFIDFKILQISDLHIDALPQLSEILPALIKNINFNLCVFTGDFRFDIHKPSKTIDELLFPIINEANRADYPALAILGNHDFLEYTLKIMKDQGLRFLINETIELKRYNHQILITGLDDVHYYRTGNLFEQREKINSDYFKLLLVHSPELYQEAALYGYDMYLCGHTHGGQICLPGGKPIISNSRAPEYFNKGRWRHLKMQGYTSLGTGASGIPLRWNCPPEIVVHRLKVSK